MASHDQIETIALTGLQNELCKMTLAMAQQNDIFVSEDRTVRTQLVIKLGYNYTIFKDITCI